MTDDLNGSGLDISFLTVPQAAEAIGVSTRTMLRWLRQGTLRCFRRGNITRISVDDLRRFIRENTFQHLTSVDHVVEN